MLALYRKLKDWIILFLADKETVYAGPGTYHWLNHEGKIILRNTQRVVGFGRPKKLDEDVRVVNLNYIIGVINTTNAEQMEDVLNERAYKLETWRQANALYSYLKADELIRIQKEGGVIAL